LEVKEQLIRLVRIQEIALESRAAHDIVEGAPARVEDIESRFRERNAEYVAVQQRHNALEEDQRLRSGELQDLEESRKKYKTDLMQVQNQREYAAMLKEIDAVEARIAEHEEAILIDLEEIETTKTELESKSSHIQEERLLVDKERDDVNKAAEAARESIVRLRAERQGLETDLPKPLVDAVARKEAGRRGIFLSRAEDGVCQSCFVRVRPQVFQEIKLASKVHSCGNCKRLLYHAGSLAPSAPPVVTPGGDQVEAVNGDSL